MAHQTPPAATLRSSAIRDLLALTQAPGVRSLAGGLPQPDTFPAARLADVARDVLAGGARTALQYGPTEGDPALRAWIAAYETARSGSAEGPGSGAGPVAPERVTVTAGSQQALDLLARVLCAPGDAVVVEEPTYLGGLQAWRAAGAVPHPVPTDADGLDVDALARLLAGGLRPVAVHTIPTFQNPTGSLLPVARRRQLAALADRYGFTVVEDDPYAELWTPAAGGPVPPVRAWNPDVVTLGSFSKTVAPGLRVGWAVLPPRLAAPVNRLKQAADLQTSTLAQALVAGLVADGAWWHAHLATVRVTYAAQGAALADALAFARPRGGMFVWARLADGTDTARLLAAGLARGVAFVPGAEFHVGRPDAATLRLAFATLAPQGLREAVERLALAHADLSADRLPADR